VGANPDESNMLDRRFSVAPLMDGTNSTELCLYL
jgi:hypothetical protein